MKLPNAENASIPGRKLGDYLLNPEHPDNQDKARLFLALGYVAENWEQLANDLKTQHLTQEATEGRPNPHGRSYLIVAPLQGPAGSAIIKSVWQIDHGSETPRFVTAYQA